MKVKLKNSQNQVKECKVGLSWTTLFFGFIPALLRGDFKWAFIQISCSIVTAGLSSILFCFIYNKLYINDLLRKGFEPMTEADRSVLISKDFITA